MNLQYECNMSLQYESAKTWVCIGIFEKSTRHDYLMQTRLVSSPKFPMDTII